MARPRKEVHWVFPVEYAEHRGISRQAVYKAIAEGRIELVQGRINRELADREWQSNTAPAEGSRGATARPENPAPGVPVGCETNSPALTYNQARTAWQLYRARLAQLEYEERAGRLVDADKVKQAAFEHARRLQEKLLALPARLGPTLVGKSRAECTRLLEVALRQVLEQASGTAASSPAAAKAS